MSINTIYQNVQKISNAAKVSEQELMETQKVLRLKEPDGKIWRALGYARAATRMMERLWVMI